MANWGTSPELPDLLPGGSRRITYREAISEAFETALQDPRVRIFGEGVTDRHGSYGTLNAISPKPDPQRVFDVPVAEGLITGVGVGMALGGLRPIVIHPRNDFLLLGLDQLCNHAAKWKMMTGQDCPLTVVTVACRGWGSAAQHSQALHATFAQFPGLTVLAPFFPGDVYSDIMYAATHTALPTVIALDKWLWKLEAPRSAKSGAPPSVPSDVTIAGIGYGMVNALMGARELERNHGIRAEVVNVHWLHPLHLTPVFLSVTATERLLVVDTGHVEYGASAEIVARVAQGLPGTRFARIGLPDSPVPACDEQNYFPSVDDVVQKALELCAS